MLIERTSPNGAKSASTSDSGMVGGSAPTYSFDSIRCWSPSANLTTSGFAPGPSTAFSLSSSMAARAEDSLLKVTKPQPFDAPLCLSCTMVMSWISPNGSKVDRSCSAVNVSGTCAGGWARWA